MPHIPTHRHRHTQLGDLYIRKTQAAKYPDNYSKEEHFKKDKHNGEVMKSETQRLCSQDFKNKRKNSLLIIAVHTSKITSENQSDGGGVQENGKQSGRVAE